MPLRRPLSRLVPITGLVAVAGGLACADSSGPDAPVVASITVEGLPDSVGIGDTLRLIGRPRAANGTSLAGVAVRWQSLSPDVATIDSAGLLSAHGVGDARLVVSAQGRQSREDTVTALVRRLPRRFTFSSVPDSLFVSVPDTFEVEVLDGAGHPLGTVPTWSSSDTTVVRVDSAGHVDAIDLGTAWIRASAGGHSDSVRVRGTYREPMAGRTYVDLSLGSQDYRMCAISSAGEAWCLRTIAGSSPERIGGTVPLRRIHTGQAAACALAADSVAYCWGSNSNAQFGVGSRQPIRSDTLMRGGAGMKWRAIAVSDHHAMCGIRAADSVVYCWGHNDATQTGRAPASQYDSLVAPFATPLKAKSVDVSFFHGCAVALDNALWCWGENIGYQQMPNASGVPVQLQPPGSFVAVTTGDYTTCALNAQGEAWCWGFYASSASGVRRPGDPVAPTQWSPRRVAADAPFVRIFSGATSPFCGLTAAGALYCWTIAPTSWSAGYVARQVMPGRTFVAYESGTRDRCALSTDGRIYCW